MTEPEVLLVGAALQEGAFVVQQVLGQGGFAITYLAHEVRLDRLVAIKEFFPVGSRRHGGRVRFSLDLSGPAQDDAREKFLGEARVLARLRHRNIVEVYASFEENGTAYMVMELLTGETLRDVVEEAKAGRGRRAGGLPEDKALFYIEQVAGALRVVHDAHYIHRDVKPENVMICAEGRAVLLDFGLNKQLAGVGQGTMQLTVGLRFGSPGYSPPEQYGQQNRFGRYTDIYALGATLYYALTGIVPEEAPERMYGGELPEVRQLSRSVTPAANRGVMWALELKGDQRPQTVDEFLNALRGETRRDANVSASAGEPTVVAPPRRPSRLAATPQVTPLSIAPAPRSAPSVASAPAAKLRGVDAGAGHRVYHHFKSGFLEILPRLLLIAALLAIFIFVARRQQEERAAHSGHRPATAHRSP